MAWQSHQTYITTCHGLQSMRQLCEAMVTSHAMSAHLALSVWHSHMLLDYAPMRPISDACILKPKQRSQSHMVTQVREAPDLMCTELGGLTNGLQAPLNTVCASVQHPASIHLPQ